MNDYSLADNALGSINDDAAEVRDVEIYSESSSGDDDVQIVGLDDLTDEGRDVFVIDLDSSSSDDFEELDSLADDPAQVDDISFSADLMGEDNMGIDDLLPMSDDADDGGVFL